MSIERVDFPAVQLLGIAERAETPQLGELIPRLHQLVRQLNPEAPYCGSARAYLFDWSETGGTAFVCYPVDPGYEANPGTEVRAFPAGTAVKRVHEGDYSGLFEAWMGTFGAIAAQGLTVGTYLWEDYVRVPDESKGMEPITHIMVEVKS